MEFMLCFSHTATRLASLPFLSNYKLHKKLCVPPHSQSKPLAVLDRRAHWASVEAHIDTHLLNSLPTSPPPVVSEPMQYLITAAPKTMAPSLCIAACELVGGDRELAVDTACALRLMHAGAWSHDRLPSLLGPPLGGNRYPAGVELLAGDAFLPFGYEMVARSTKLDPELALRVILEMTEAMGAAGLPEGQWRRARGDAAATWVCEKTEGRLSACGAACGAVLGGGDEEVVERLRKFGLFAGTMYGLLISAAEEEKVEAAEVYRSMAASVVEGFEEGKEEAFLELVEYWWESNEVMRYN